MVLLVASPSGVLHAVQAFLDLDVICLNVSMMLQFEQGIILSCNTPLLTYCRHAPCSWPQGGHSPFICCICRTPNTVRWSIVHRPLSQPISLLFRGLCCHKHGSCETHCCSLFAWIRRQGVAQLASRHGCRDCCGRACMRRSQAAGLRPGCMPVTI